MATFSFQHLGRKLIMFRVLPNNVVSDANYLILNYHTGFRESTTLKEKLESRQILAWLFQMIVCIVGSFARLNGH